jgi:hypothetical protein
MVEVRTCARCKRDKEESDFPKPGATSCRACKTKAQQIRRSASPENYLKGVLASNRTSHKRRTLMDMDYSITIEDLVDLWEKQEGQCALSNVFMTHHKDGSGTKEYNASIDRINGNKGYTPDNIQLVCYRINMMKSTLSEDLFYWWVKNINAFSCEDNN